MIGRKFMLLPLAILTMAINVFWAAILVIPVVSLIIFPALIWMMIDDSYGGFADKAFYFGMSALALPMLGFDKIKDAVLEA